MGKHEAGYPRGTVWKMVRELRAEFLYWIPFIICAVLTNIASSWTWRAGGGALDAAILTDRNALINWVLQALFMVAFCGVFGVIRTKLRAKWTENSKAHLKKKAALTVMQIETAWLDRHGSADLLSRAQRDTDDVINGISAVFGFWIGESLWFVSTAAVMCTISVRLTLLSFGLMPVLMLVQTAITRPVQRLKKQVMESRAGLTALSQDAIVGWLPMKAFCLERSFIGRLMEKQKRFVKINRNTALYTDASETAAFIFVFIPRIIIFVAGAYEVMRGRLTLGVFAGFIMLASNLSNPLFSIGSRINSLHTLRAASARLFEIFEAPREPAGGELFNPDSGPAIEFCGVTFGYDAAHPVLHNISFQVNRGENVALVGPTGCGKSTVLKLACRIYEPVAGEIRFLGHDLRAWNIPAARGHMGYVGQDSHMFPESLYQNVEYGREGATREEVADACGFAGIAELIESLPGGYDTQAGELGSRLSGGQKQRLAIARALLRDADLLIFDEATSSLDNLTEQEVQKSIGRISEGRTVLTVAHRLSSIIRCDRIIVFEDGRIVAEGTHERLLRDCALYRRLYERNDGEEVLVDA